MSFSVRFLAAIKIKNLRATTLNEQVSHSYPTVAEAVGGEGFTASFQDKLIFLSPINEGVLECRG